MKTKGDIITVGIDSNAVTSVEGFITLPHITMDEFDHLDADLFILPGGNPQEIKKNTELADLLKKLDREKKVIAAICAAPLILASSGILKGKRFTTTLPVAEFPEFKDALYQDQDLVVYENIITARANAYVDFAIEIGKKMDIFDGAEDLEETIRYFKFFQQG